MKRFMSWFSVGLVLLLFAPTSARAGVIFGFDDGRLLPDGSIDPVIYPVGQFPYGFENNSAFISNQGFRLIIDGNYTSNWSGSQQHTSLFLPFDFFETSTSTEISDILWLSLDHFTQDPPGLVQVDAQLFSDDQAGSRLLNSISNPTDIRLVETGDFIQLDPYIQAAGGPTDLSVSVRSPEPSTIVLLGSALLMIGGHRFLRWRRKR